MSEFSLNLIIMRNALAKIIFNKRQSYTENERIVKIIKIIFTNNI